MDEDPPRPMNTRDRRRVPYFIPGVADMRVFIEKSTSKQPIQQQMEADAGLVRSGTVLFRPIPFFPTYEHQGKCLELGAINEWRTWFVADAL